MPAPVVVYADFESTIDTQLRVFHAPHKSEENLRPFMEYVIQLQESVKTYLFDEMPLESTSKIEKDFRSTTVCPFCHKKLEGDKVRHHAHVASEYTTGNGEVRFFEAEQYVHLHLLYQVQSPTLVQQEELSFAHLLSQWIALRFCIHHETHRSSFNL